MLDQPGVFTYRDGVAVIQLVAFTIYLGFSFVLCWRHGFRRSEGWVILVTFSILRVLAACFQLAIIKHPSRSVYGGALICQGIGLAPLTLLNFGVFGRLNKFVNIIQERILSIISLASIAGIAMAIYGGVQSADSATLATNNLLKVSVIIFVACYLAFMCLFLIILRQWKSIPKAEQKLLVCFACCVPFMVVRFLFGILGTFDESLRSHFSVLAGNVTIFLCMAVLEEIIVVAFFVFTGMRLERLPSAFRHDAKPDDPQGVSELRSRG